MSAFLLSTTASAEDTGRRVRVGYFIMPGIQERDADGMRSGYNYEYIRAVANAAGWQLDFVGGSLPECLRMLISGEIDIMGSMQHTEQRGHLFLFPDIPLSVSHSVLRVHQDSSVAYEDFERFNDMSIGVHRDDGNFTELLKYADTNGFTARMKFFDSDAELSDGLQRGDIDMMFVPSLRSSPNSREVARFASRPNYIAVTRSRPDLLLELNQVQSRLLVSDPLLQVKLTTKYTTRDRDSTVVLSAREKAYIAEHTRVRAAYTTHNEPIEYRDPATGTIAGTMAMLMNVVAARSGLDLEFIPTENKAEARALLAKSEVDIVCSFELDDDLSIGDGIKSTQPYAFVPMVSVTNASVPVKKYVIAAGSMTKYWMSRLTSDAETVTARTESDCLDMVVRGEASTTFTDSYVMNYHLADPRFAKLSTVGIPNYTKALRFGLSPSAPPELLSILNKTVSTISEAEIGDMLFTSLLKSRPFTLRMLISRNPITSVSILAAIVSVIIAMLLVNIRSRERAARKMREMLYVDALTGGWTAQRFREEAERALTIHPKTPYAIVYFDIKAFKFINDEYGYMEGDRVLKAVAEHLLHKINKGEMTTRITADHFALMIRALREKAVDRVKEILNGMQAIPQMNQYQLVVGAGIYIRMEGEANVSVMLDRANYACGRAKADLFENVQLYNESIRESIRGEKEIEAVMHDALANGRFVPFYQPKVDMLTGRMVGAEALVRWIDPEIGIILPGRFVPLFEKNGFIVKIDRYIYEQTCKNIRRWREAFGEVVPMSCNFSRLHIRDKNLLDRIVEIASRYEVPPRCVEIEMTESVAIENDEYFVALSVMLRRSGFRVAIDDFGSGYSSLRFLQKLSADVLKLDKDFADSILNSAHRVIVAGIVDIAHKLNMEVVCEGIETEEQANFLQSINCRTAQGYYYAHPMSVPDFEEFMRQRM